MFTITCLLFQVDDAGWWEGMRDGKIGWFPSGYVKDVAPGMFFSPT